MLSDKYEISITGKIKKENELCKTFLNEKGYECIMFMGKKFKVHRLVALKFIPNPENKPEINHKDGNKLNNHVDNLEWCTRKENMAHAKKMKLMPKMKGSKNPFSKLTEKQVNEIRSKYIPNIYSQNKLAKEYNVSRSCICMIVTNRNWV